MLRSTFSGFTTAQMAMSASQRALDVTGQNLSNLNTIGYTRQRLDLASISPVGASYGSSRFDSKVGQGVQMTGISQIRDPFLDKQYRNQIVKVGTADAMDQILQEIGNAFDESKNEGVRAALDSLISQLKNMASVPNSDQASSDAMVRSASEVLLNAIHQKDTVLKDVEKGTIEKLEDSLVPKINQCIKRITELNESIKTSQILGNPALELQDERNQMIDDLATYLPIKASYTTQKLGGGISVDVLDITFTTTDTPPVEYSLVSDVSGSEFDLQKTNGGLPLTLTIKDAKTGVVGADISNSLENGVLKGNFDMLNKSEVFDGSDVKGIGYYSQMFDAFVDKFATMMNDLNAGPDLDNNGNKVRHDLFEKSNPNDPSFTAGNIKISEGWMNGTVSITRSQNTGAGGTTESTAYDNILKMIDTLGTEKVDFGNGVFHGTFLQCFNNLQSTQAIEREATVSILKNHSTVLNQIANSKDSVSGVYMDEEVMNLMRFQQSYNAAARLMTTLDEALNTLITSTGVVGR